MKHEISYGIIPVKKVDGEWHVLLIQHGSGFWSFPKGHPDSGETVEQTAQRELKEETGLDIQCFLLEKKFLEKYQFYQNGEKVSKTVEYLLAEVSGQVQIQVEELKNAIWVPFKDASKFITYPEAQRICIEAYSHLIQR